MGGEHKYTKYKKRLSIILLSSMLLSVTEPFIGLTIGVDKDIEILEDTEEVDVEVGLEGSENTDLEITQGGNVPDNPKEEAIIEDVEFTLEESLEQENTQEGLVEDLPKEADEKPTDYIKEDETQGGNTKARMSGLTLQSEGEPVYVLEDESKFAWDEDGSDHYKGSQLYVEVPHYFGGQLNTTLERMFSGKRVLGVKSTNTNIYGTENMFTNLQSDTLDVSQLYTKNVSNMSGMFQGAQPKEIYFGNFNTEKVNNMSIMFRNSKAEALDLQTFSTANVGTMEQMFSGSYAKELDLRHFSTGKVTKMQGMFKNAKSEVLRLTGWDTSKVVDMNELFMGVLAKEVDTSSFDTSRVTSMNGMFQGSQIEELNLSNFNTGKVSDMGNMFTGAKARKIDVSSFNTENVYNMKDMFQGTASTTLDLRSFNTERITDMGGMFKDSQASKIDVSSFTTNYVTDMSEMFMNTQASELDLSSFDMGSVNDTTNMFKGTTATKGYARTQRDADILNNSEGKPDYIHFESRYVVPKDTDFQGSTNGSFRYIGKDEYIEMPHVIKEIPVVSYKSMFEGTSVKGVVSTNKNIKDMTRMFYGNTSTNLDVSNIDTSGVTTMGSMFEYANTNTINVQNFGTSKVEYMGYMFKDTKVKNLDLSSFNMVNVKNTEGMFQRSTATQGYARTREDADKINGSTNKPTSLNFTVWSIIVNPDTREWTNKSVNLIARGESQQFGVDYIDLVSNDYQGRNLLLNGNFQNGMSYWSGSNTRIDAEGLHVTAKDGQSYPRIYGHHPIFKKMKKGETYTLSFEGKGHNGGSRSVSIAMGNSSSMIMSMGVPEYTPEWQRYEMTFTVTGDSIDDKDFVFQVWVDGHKTSGDNTRSFRKFKLERGRTATPFSLAPEDVELINNQKEYEVSENGTYIFRVVDTNGNTKEVAHTVSNIDYTKPTATLTSSPEGWTSQDVSIYVNAEDELSGVKSITLPNGEKVTGNKAEYKVTDNGEYTFKVTDNAGNASTHTETITNIDKSVPSSNAKVLNKEWTRDTVDVEVSSEESASGLTNIEMINSPLEGRNLLRLNKESRDIKWNGWDYGLTYPSETPLSDLGLNYGDELTLSFNVEKTNRPIRAFLQFRNKVGGSYIQYSGNTINEGSKGFTSITATIPTKTSQGSPLGAVYSVAPTVRNNSNNNGAEATINSPKLEVGKITTPWTPAPEDIKLINNKKVYPVASNGIYTFKSTYNNGTTSESSVNVTNIDRTIPTVKVSGNKEDWTEEDSITLTIDASDTQSGVKSITLPDGSVVNASSTTYNANENKDYEFIVTDNVGNTTTHTETVDRLMVPYTFYLFDAKGNPLQGAGFELYRDGSIHASADSDKDGLVDFGKVPPTGRYTIKQVKAPDGYVVNPDEKDVEVGDETEPEEFISYPRGEELPGTGTRDNILYTVITGGILMAIVYIRNKLKVQKSK